jgi:hypothetical protein
MTSIGGAKGRESTAEAALRPPWPARSEEPRRKRADADVDVVRLSFGWAR